MAWGSVITSYSIHYTKLYDIFDPQSSLVDLPEHLDRNHLLTILGNLLDNAFDGPGGPSNGVEDVSFAVNAGETLGLVGERNNFV